MDLNCLENKISKLVGVYKYPYTQTVSYIMFILKIRGNWSSKIDKDEMERRLNVTKQAGVGILFRRTNYLRALNLTTHNHTGHEDAYYDGTHFYSWVTHADLSKF